MKSLTLASFAFYLSCLWLLFASSICTLCTCNASSDHIKCIATERLALIQLKNNLVDGANRLSSWSGDDCCSWFGVVCDNFTHNVHEIRLRGPDNGPYGNCVGWYANATDKTETRKEKLGGIISPSLIKLQQLRYLDLSCNDFGFTRIPAFIGSLQNLRYLNISWSQFAGEIPHQIGNLSRLRVLDVQMDPVSHSSHGFLHSQNLKWIENMKQLEYLNMGNSNLTGASNWFQVINTLPSLQQLHLSWCLLNHFPSEPTRVNFTSITILDLSGNFFPDSLFPRWFFSLHNLVSLDLTFCSISGLSPGTRGGFDSMPSLRTLRLSNNSFVNSSFILKWLPSLSNLQLLEVRDCSLSDPILGSLQNLSQIVHLDLSGNQIVEEIPRSLSNLCNLTTLDLQGNKFYGDVSEILERFCECESPKLEVLQLEENNLTGRLPRSLRSLSLLLLLDLNNNQIEGSIPDSIGDLSSLEFLDLSYNKLNGSIPESIGNLGELYVLSLHHNLLTWNVIENHFANLTVLDTLWVGDNINLTFDLDNNWIPPFQLGLLNLCSCNLGPLFPSWVQSQTKLVALDLPNTNIADTIPDWWMNWESLRFVNLEKNKLSGIIPSSLGNILGLRILLMGNNKLSGDIPVSLFNSKSLVIVDLAENELTGNIRIPMSVEGRSDDMSLRVLSLRSNKLEGEIKNDICHLSRIQILDIADNSFSGYLPTCFTNITVLSGKSEPSFPFQDFTEYNVQGHISLVIKGRASLYDKILNLVTALDLSDNNFFGSIPNELLALPGLRYLNLSQNKLTGRIPDTFGEMIVLESLDLSENTLEGNIPFSLAKLTALSLLNVSYNNLTGTIPIGSQLQTFNESSFVGNRLCGDPLPRCRQNTENTTATDDDNGEPDGTDWILVICMIVGFAVGFWVMISTLIVSRKWRDAYYHFLDQIRIKIATFILLVSI